MKKILIALILTITSNYSFSSEKITEVGKIEFNQKSNSFIFYFIKDNAVKSIMIRPTDKKELDLLKSFKGKIAVLSGEINPFVQSKEGFQFVEELNNPKLKELNSELLKIDSKKMITQYNLVSHEKKLIKVKTSDTLVLNNLPDKPTNTVIGIAGAIVGIATGPIALVPAAAYLIEEGLNK